MRVCGARSLKVTQIEGCGDYSESLKIETKFLQGQKTAHALSLTKVSGVAWMRPEHADVTGGLLTSVHACFKHMNLHIASSNESLYHNLSVTIKLQNTFKQHTAFHICPYSNPHTSLFGNHDSSNEYESLAWRNMSAHAGNQLFYSPVSQICSVR